MAASGATSFADRLTETLLKVPGASGPFAFAHWTDLHLSECDQRETPQVQGQMAAIRRDSFPEALLRAEQAVKRINSLAVDFVAVGGDVMHAPTATRDIPAGS